MALAKIEEQVFKQPTKEEQLAAFVQREQADVATESRRRAQWLEQKMARLWDSGIQYLEDRGTNQRVAVQAGLTPEEKIQALNDAGLAVEMFDAASKDIALLAAHVEGLTVKVPDNKANYDVVVTDGKVVLTKK